MEERPHATLHYSAVARDGSLVQRSRDSVRSAFDYTELEGLEESVQTVAKRAVALLKAPPCEGGTYTVVLDPQLGGVFAHEAFGHLSEADHLYENEKMRDLMYIGREMGVKELNIIDDGSPKGYAGTHAFDDEGTPTSRTYLIKDGILAGHLHSLETAGKMGGRPTGNARALNRSFPPIVRMTNTYIDKGATPAAEIFSGIENGVYAVAAVGGQTMAEMFTFSAEHGYRIENGEVTELLRDIVLTGNVFETLKNIEAIGDDLTILSKGGGCGKGGQSPLPVSFGSPHMRIADVVIGGK
jgi:TldD protein